MGMLKIVKSECSTKIKFKKNQYVSSRFNVRFEGANTNLSVAEIVTTTNNDTPCFIMVFAVCTDYSK